MFVKYAQASSSFPAASARSTSCSSRSTLVQTGKIDHFPVILFGTAYWQAAGRLAEHRSTRTT